MLKSGKPTSSRCLRRKWRIDVISSVSLGRKAERDCVNELTLEGFKLFRPQKTSFFGTQDIFIFDILALNEIGLRFIQVKKNGTQGFLKKLKLWSEEYTFPNTTWELWVRLYVKKYKKKWNKYIFYMGERIL